MARNKNSSQSQCGSLKGVSGEKNAMESVNATVLLINKSIKAGRNKTLFMLGFVVVLAAVIGIYVGPTIKAMLEASNEPPPVIVVNELTDAEKAEILKNKSIEIKNIVIGEARQRKELLVLERDVSVENQWESSWAGLDVFKKVKKVVSFGTGYYNIDLSGLADDGITVDHETKIVELALPHAFLKSISIDEGKTQYEDTQKGLLSFGELKLTMEQQALLDLTVEDGMRQQLEAPELLQAADDAGKLAVGEIYKPLVTAIASGYHVVVKIV